MCQRGAMVACSKFFSPFLRVHKQAVVLQKNFRWARLRVTEPKPSTHGVHAYLRTP